MITDEKLIKRVEKIVHSKTRYHVTVADVLAVIQKESSGVPIFNPNHLPMEDKENLLFRQNLAEASRLSGVSKPEILKINTILTGEYKGEIAKFRCEPGYMRWAKNLKGTFTPVERMLLACSLGAGQKMVRWLVDGSTKPRTEWLQFALKFAGDLDLQLQYCAGDLESLLSVSHSRELAYTRYNAGGSAKAVTPYGTITKGYYDAYVKAGH